MRFEWDTFEADVKKRRAAGEIVGLGLAMYVEKSGLGPTDGARVNVHTNGEVEVITGGASVGQGFETVIAQVAAQTLGVDYRKVRVVHGRTDRIEYGIGAHATRATVMTANATMVAAEKVRAKALDIAAQLLQADAANLTIVDGVVLRADGSSANIDLGQLAHHLRPTSPTRGEREPGLASDGWFTTNHMTYPYGVQLALVKLDPGTGGVTVEKMLIAFDVGRAINPMSGAGSACRWFRPRARRRSVRGVSIRRTRSATLRHLRRLSDTDGARNAGRRRHDGGRPPSTCNPLGIKGAGEGGVAAVGAVIASAVDDALGGEGLITQIPIRPQMIKALLDKRRV